VQNLSDGSPYISVVVTARNDNHGGNLLPRMQAFVNGWIGQSKRHGLSSELIVVDWNPPEDRSPLIDALRWPADTRPCRVRFIQVPPEIHRRHKHAETMPLYQMIAKNAGIRRSQGRFVLATNIDIIFSDELVRHLAQGQLKPGRMYRIDRHDVMSDVPVDGSVEDQLEYCKTHLIRVNAREGTFNLTPDGLRALSEEDIADCDSGISLGAGWYSVERNSAHQVFRWVDNDAEVTVKLGADSPAPLVFDVEPGPGVNRQPFTLQVLDAGGNMQAQVWIRGRENVRLQLPPGGDRTRNFRLHVAGGGISIPEDPRILNFRVYRCVWAATAAERRDQIQSDSQIEPPASETRNGKPEAEFVLSSRPASLPAQTIQTIRLRNRLRDLMRVVGQSNLGTPLSVPVPRALRRFLHLVYVTGGVPGVHRRDMRIRLAAKVPAGQDIFEPGSGIAPGAGWYDLEHVRGETFRWVRNDAELIVLSPPESAPRALVIHIEPGPGMNWKRFELVVRDQSGCTVATARVETLQHLEIPIAWRPDHTQVFSLHVEGGDRPTPNDPRLLNFRLFWCGLSGTPVQSLNHTALEIPIETGLSLGGGWRPGAPDASGDASVEGRDGAEILTQLQLEQHAGQGPRVMRLDIAPVDDRLFHLEVRESSGKVVAKGPLRGRQICYLTLPIRPGQIEVFSLHSSQVNFHLYRLGWSDTTVDITEFASGLRTGAGWSSLHWEQGEICRLVEREAELEITVPSGEQRYLALDLSAGTSDPVAFKICDSGGRGVAQFSIGPRKTVYAEIPWHPGLRDIFRLVAPGVRVYGCEWSPRAGEPERISRHFKCEGAMAGLDQDIVMMDSGLSLGKGWYRPEGSGDEVYRWASNQAEIFVAGSAVSKSVVLEPFVIDIEAGPSLESESFELQVFDRAWHRICEVSVTGRQVIRLDLPLQFGQANVYRLVVKCGGLVVADDPRTLNFRVFRLDCARRRPAAMQTAKWSARVISTRDRYSSAPLRTNTPNSYPVAPTHLHTNACGDFTLMARDHWFDLRGYPEFDMYSFNIDSVLCYAAHHAGAREETLTEPLRIYHIEHALGSGWTPEGQAKLFEGLRAKGVAWLEYQELVALAVQMRKLNAPMIFNRENWGLAEFELREMLLGGTSKVQTAR
jgi:hypothetical protein